MKRFSPQQRVLGGALLLAVGLWAVDAFSGGARVTLVRAASGSTPAPPPAPTSPDWKDIDVLVARLTRSAYTPAREELGRLERDLFVPTARLEAACAPPEPPPIEVPTSESAPPVPASQPEFQTRHKLTGVVIGPNPLAVVDQTVLRLNSDLEGYTLIEVQRDYVVFRQAGTDERVVLSLQRRR